jgi:Tfp pilus assembly protein PilO
MSARLTDRLWLVAGVLGAVILLAIGWFFFIVPQREQAQRLSEETTTEIGRLDILKARLKTLEEQFANKQQYETTLANLEEALPKTDRMSEFLRQLQKAGEAAGVNVSAVTVGAPGSVATVPNVRTLPISLVAKGQQADVYEFLYDLQQKRPRAVLVQSVNTAPEGANSALGKAISMSITLQAFVDVS